MKSLIIYWSGTGNTKKVAETIRHALKNGGVNSSLKRVEEAKDEDLYTYELVFIGTPSFMWQPPARRNLGRKNGNRKANKVV